MKLEVRKLGIVDYAEIDLNIPLTLFCGPNGTGKTYMAYLINAIHTIASDIALMSLPLDTSWFNSGEIKITEDIVKEWLNQLQNALYSQLPYIFGVSSSEGRSMFTSTEIKFNPDSADMERISDGEESIRVHLGSKYLFRIKKPKGSNTIFKESGESRLDSLSPDTLTSISQGILNQILKSLLLGNNPSRMLTVERNSIYTFKTELLGNRLDTVDQVLISETDNAGEIVRKRTTLYPLAVRNSLKIANELEEIIKKESEYTAFAEEIEREVLTGTVSIGKEGDVRFMPVKTTMSTPVALPIRVSSSAVKTLSGLVIYLKHLARKGDLLIIDEPEMNLHPDNQRRLARIFARMLNKGIRLIISTHSDYIIRELNNLVMLSSLERKHLNPIEGYSNKEAIDKSLTQAFLFNNDGERVTAIPIEIDEFGLSVKTIDDTIESQNEATIILRDTLEENMQG